jgi:2-phosphosulfolactate phosphatase
MMKEIDVCLSPELIPHYALEGKIAVVIDVLRATISALHNGVKEIYPVSTIEECILLKEKGYLTAAERNGETVPGFDFGNSPYSYIDNEVEGLILGMTTTNGTKSIQLSSHAKQVIIGSFINLNAIVEYLKTREEDVVFVCAGWKSRANLEDTLFAGFAVNLLKKEFNTMTDGAILALALKQQCDLFDSKYQFLKDCNHVKRLSKQNGIMRDIEYCLTENISTIIPVLNQNKLIALT